MLFLCAIVWGLAFAFQRTAADQINPIAFNGLRFSMASGVVFVFLLFYELVNKKKGIKSVGWNKATILGGIICGVSLWLASNLQQYGIQYTSAGRASFITALYIVLVPVLGLFAGRRIGILNRFAIPVAIAGFWLMCSNGNGPMNIGDLLGLASTLFFAFQISFIDLFGQDADPIKLTLVQFLTCAVISVPGMAVAGFPSATSIADSIVPIIYVGIFSAGIGYTLQTVGQKYTEPSVAALIMSLESVVGMIGGVLILHEAHTLQELSGCMLVFIAVIFAQMSFSKNFLQFDKKRYILTTKTNKKRGADSDLQ